MRPPPAVLEGAGVFLVGGAVRDGLLGVACGERDWVVVGGSERLMLAHGFRRVGADFPVYLHPETQEEYALARQERKTGAGYHGFATATGAVSLEEDLARRDLTINAMARGGDGGLIDPYGGRRDLEARLLRHVSPAFVEDPLRVLRVARFAAQLAEFGFEVAAETRDLLTQMSAGGELAALPAERVWAETEKALRTVRPRRYFEVLREVGALRQILPEVDALFGVPQRAEFHPEVDAGLHTMLCMDRIAALSDCAVERFAVLGHDLGKGTTPRELWPRHSGHEARSAELVAGLCRRLRVPNRYRHLAVLVARHHLVCHKALRAPAAQVEAVLAALGAWGQQSQSRVAAFARCCMADAQGRTGLESRAYPQRAFLGEAEVAGGRVGADGLLAAGVRGAELGRRLAELRATEIAGVQERYADFDELGLARG